MQFRPYQSEYVDNIALNKSNLLVAPMRSGKSLIMTGIIDKYFKDQFVLIIVGMRNVILQLSDYYADHTFILAGKDFDHSKHIQLATFQTFGRRSIDLTQYAAVFVDEAHMRFNTDLVKQIRDLTCTRVFFTGTPLFPNNKRMNQHVDNVLQHITVEEMINSNYLAPTRFMAVGNMLKDESELSTQNGDYLNEDIDRIIDKQALIQWIVVDNIKYEWSSKHKTIMYTNSIATAERISAAFNSPDVRIIHSKLTSKQMDATMEWFHSTPNGIIINCRMLTVGVDIPSADTIVYLLPTKIHSLYLQSIFRASTVFGDKVATVYDYSGMLGKVNPYTDFSEYSKKLSCKEECAKSYPNDPLAQYFCLESCTSNPILIQCNGELPVSYINNPIISNFQVHKGTPCLEAHPVYRMEYKQTEPSPGMIRKWCKCKCGCVTSYDVKTLTEPADMIQLYSDAKNLNTVTVIYSEQHRKALALFDAPKADHYQVIMFNSSADLYSEACKFFANKPFQILSNAQLKLPNVSIDQSLGAAIPLISWNSDNELFINKLIRAKLTALCDEWAIKRGFVHYSMQSVNSDNEKKVLQFLNLTYIDRSKIVSFFKKLQGN